MNISFSKKVPAWLQGLFSFNKVMTERGEDYSA